MFAAYCIEVSDKSSGQLTYFLGVYSTLELAQEYTNKDKVQGAHLREIQDIYVTYYIVKCELDVPMKISDSRMPYNLDDGTNYYSDNET